MDLKVFDKGIHMNADTREDYEAVLKNSIKTCAHLGHNPRLFDIHLIEAAGLADSSGQIIPGRMAQALMTWTRMIRPEPDVKAQNDHRIRIY